MKNSSNFDFSALATMCQWERQKAIYLIQIAEEIGMEYAESYGCVAVNQTSGNTYIWCEDYNFCLYMPINCDLCISDIMVMWTNLETGEEVEESLAEFENIDLINEWTDYLNANSGLIN